MPDHDIAAARSLVQNDTFAPGEVFAEIDDVMSGTSAGDFSRSQHAHPADISPAVPVDSEMIAVMVLDGRGGGARNAPLPKIGPRRVEGFPLINIRIPDGAFVQSGGLKRAVGYDFFVFSARRCPMEFGAEFRMVTVSRHSVMTGATDSSAKPSGRQTDCQDVF